MAFGRQIAACVGLLAIAVVVFGCGSSDPESATIDPNAASSINAKLDQIGERVAAQDCFGDDSATSSLETLQAAVDGDLLAGEDETFKSDLQDLLNRLGDQIDTECQPAAETTSSSSTETTDTLDPVSTTSTTTTSTDIHSDTTKPEPTTPTPPPTNPGDGPPVTPPGHSDEGGSGGISPGGFAPRRKAEKKAKRPDKPKDHKDAMR